MVKIEYNILIISFAYICMLNVYKLFIYFLFFVKPQVNWFIFSI